MNLIPERSGVIFFNQMNQFMNNYIINYWYGSHDQSPGKIQISQIRTGTPSLSGVRNFYLIEFKSLLLGVPIDSFRYFLKSQSLKTEK